MNHLLSVIVPVYNVELYLERCIDSIINQTYKNLEIILINDGSTDKSESICNYYAKKDNRIIVLNQENGGSSIARNTGLKKCKGDFIGFVDSDDWLKANMFYELITFAINHDLKVVECSSIQSHLKEANKTSNKDNIEIHGVIENRDSALKRIIEKKRFAVWRRLYHKSILKDRFFIENILHQDVYYTIDILNNISKIGFIKNQLYVYNVQNPNSVIRSNYSIKKLKSINAGSYVVKQTVNYNNEIQTAAKHYLIEFLRYHYNSLYKHQNLDNDFINRKKIKATIKKYHSFKDFDFYSSVIILLPKKLYSLFLISNQARIKTQIKIRQYLKNV